MLVGLEVEEKYFDKDIWIEYVRQVFYMGKVCVYV